MWRCGSIAALFTLVAALVSGCETSATVATGPNPVKCQVSLGAMSAVDPGGGSASLAITTQPECAWDVSTNVSWISGLSPTSGQGTANIAFRVAANDGASSREGMIVVNGELARVSQRAPCRYDVGPSSHSVGVEGGAASIRISTENECTWTAAVDVSWISLTSSAAGSGNGTVSFTVAPNQGEARSGAVGVANQRSSVTQAGVSAESCNATFSPTSQNLDAAGGAGIRVTVTAASPCQWIASSNASWINITSGAIGTGNGTVIFSVAANTGPARTGTLTIVGRTFTVTQAAGGNNPPSPPPPSPPPPPPPPPPSPPRRHRRRRLRRHPRRRRRRLHRRLRPAAIRFRQQVRACRCPAAREP